MTNQELTILHKEFRKKLLTLLQELSDKLDRLEDRIVYLESDMEYLRNRINE